MEVCVLDLHIQLLVEVCVLDLHIQLLVEVCTRSTHSAVSAVALLNNALSLCCNLDEFLLHDFFCNKNFILAEGTGINIILGVCK